MSQSYRPIAKVLSFLAGACLLLLGLTWIFIAASGAMRTGQEAGYVAGAGFVLAASPLISYPFSVRLAKVLGVVVMFVLASGMLWLAFRPDLPVERPELAQVAAIAFGVLLLARVGLALRRKYSRLGT